MDDERLEGPVAQDLSARRTATTVPIEAQDEIIGDAHADLKAPPEHGRETIRASGNRLARTAQGTEGGDAGAKPVPKGRVTWSADASALRRTKTAPATWASSHPASWPYITGSPPSAQEAILNDTEVRTPGRWACATSA